MQEAAKAQKILNEWVMQTRDLTQRDRVEAASIKADAEALHKAANEDAAAATKMRANARTEKDALKKAAVDAHAALAEKIARL